MIVLLILSITFSVRSKGFLGWIIVDLVRHRHYSDSVAQLGRLLAIVEHMSDRCSCQ